MILSFHPNFNADKNISCAGREPGGKELDAILQAGAVILPQGCPESLYQMARSNCRHVFPNYDVRYQYPGKTGQIRLFQETRAPHPASRIFNFINEGRREYLNGTLPFRFPFVFKRDWGGEGEGVFLADSPSVFENIMKYHEGFEKNHLPFILQEYIPCRNRSLRVVVIHQSVISYWRVQKDSDRFLSNLSAGGVLDSLSDPDCRQTGTAVVVHFCQKTGINLAGFDLIFPESDPSQPLFLEINYYFGRKGLGGSLRYYEILEKEIQSWIQSIGNSKPVF
ncbi:MAG: glutathione synthase [Thermodesulfobacteriota bacterium]